MTNQEAIELLQTPIHCADKGDEKDMREALSMAIKALKNHDTFMKYSYEQGKKDALSQQSCDDAEQIDYHDDFATALKKINDYEMTRNERAAISILNAYKVGYESGMEDLKQEQCTDAVSREAVLNAICDYVAFEEYEDKSHTFTIRPLTKRIKQLPSVTQKSGKWINDKNDIPICSRCGYIPQYDRAIDDYEYSNYCPLCGADMREEQTE